jgi:hypothetical protein
MDKSEEENAKIYILESKQSIDTYINRKEFRRAFGLLILVLELLDENEKKEAVKQLQINYNTETKQNSTTNSQKQFANLVKIFYNSIPFKHLLKEMSFL